MTLDLDAAKADLAGQGFHVVERAISGDLLVRVRHALDEAVRLMREHGISTFSETLDPNDANIRVYHLPEWDRVFTELLRHPIAMALVEAALGPHTMVSNFTANIALPGSGSMNLHSDQALVVPPPWNEPWTMNVIWCVDDVHEANGATRYVPGSQHYTRFEDVPADLIERSVAFSAPAGSIVAMEGRVWHTSGANVTNDERRAMMFAYYSRDFIRPQVNWSEVLSPATKAALDAQERHMFGLAEMGNITVGGALTRLRDGARPDTVPLFKR